MKKYARINFNGNFWKFAPVISGRINDEICEQQINDKVGINLYDISKHLLSVFELSITLLPSDHRFENFPPQKFLGYDDWAKNMIKTYDCKNEAAIYKNMQLCSATLEDCDIAIFPNNHSSTRGWDGMDEKFATVISSNSPPEIIGAAVKYSIARCTGKGADLVANKLLPDGVPDTFDDYLKSLSL